MRRFLLLVIIVALIVLGGWAAGWIKLSDNTQTTTIVVDKDKAKDDMKNMEQSTKDAAVKVKDKVVEGAEAAKDAIQKRTTTTATTTTTTTTETK